MEFGFLDFFFLFFILFFYSFFSSLNDELEINIKKRYSDDVNYNLNLILMTNSSSFLLTILLKNCWKKITARRQYNKLDLQQK